MRRRSRLLTVTALVSTLVVLAGCSGTKAPTVSSDAGTGSPTAVPGVATDLQPFYMQQLHWRGCGDGFQCATLSVPLNYEHPEEQTLHLALDRLPASDQKHRIGSLVINPGGPGGSGYDYARAARNVISEPVRDRYDVVGFDPRGVGRSDPIHCLTPPETDAFFAADPAPTTPAEVDTVEGLAKNLALGCNTSDELPFLGTRDAAHDMDVLRSALGDAKLNYLGKSYGTFLGATYADEFPTDVGRMVLDGVIDPSLTSSQFNLGQAIGFERATRAFMTDCATHADCPLGTNVDAGLVRLQQFLTGLGAKPLSTKDSRRPLTQGLGSYGVAYAMYDQRLWVLLRASLKQAMSGNGQDLLSLADSYTERKSNGSYSGNLNDALFAVNCLDRSQTGGVAQIQSDATTFAQQAPIWGPMLAWSSLPCVYWQVKPTDGPKRITAPGSGPILVVGTTRDPATPYEWAQGLASQLSNGHLLTRDGDGHTAYREGSQCVDSAVDAYLLKRVVPPDGKRC